MGSKSTCTSKSCSHTKNDFARMHCDTVMCGNYVGDCPVH